MDGARAAAEQMSELKRLTRREYEARLKFNGAAPTEPGANATAGPLVSPCARRQRAVSSASTRSWGTGHSGGNGAPSGKASAAFLSMNRGKARSPQRHLLTSPNLASPTKPILSGMPASAGAMADFQVRGRIRAVR